MTKIEVIIEDLKNHPKCPHGPTLLFSRIVDGQQKKFYACSACRDRKDCEFFVWENQLHKLKSSNNQHWISKTKNYTAGINHKNLYMTFNKVLTSPAKERMYCHDCNSFQLAKYKEKHREHDISEDISDRLMRHPSEFLKPLDNAKKEAQYLFSEKSIKVIVDILKQQNLLDVLCIGCPRIHEFISDECGNMSSLLLDFDKRYHNFFGPLEFCWFNSFNNHFFLNDSYEIFKDFLTNKPNLVLVTDPPFGGRIEPLADTFTKINNLWKQLNKVDRDLPIIWVFPYFMEPPILNSFPNFNMLDYKVDYDNHILFSDGPKGRKQGSPVRIFTNIDPQLITLPEEDGYKYCKLCKRWVASENKHCKSCKTCTSKNGETYIHCNICARCVKPTWTHCDACSKCALPQHKCGKKEEEEKEKSEDSLDKKDKMFRKSGGRFGKRKMKQMKNKNKKIKRS